MIQSNSNPVPFNVMGRDGKLVFNKFARGIDKSVRLGSYSKVVFPDGSFNFINVVESEIKGSTLEFTLGKNDGTLLFSNDKAIKKILRSENDSPIDVVAFDDNTRNAILGNKFILDKDYATLKRVGLTSFLVREDPMGKAKLFTVTSLLSKEVELIADNLTDISGVVGFEGYGILRDSEGKYNIYGKTFSPNGLLFSKFMDLAEEPVFIKKKDSESDNKSPVYCVVKYTDDNANLLNMTTKEWVFTGNMQDIKIEISYPYHEDKSSDTMGSGEIVIKYGVFFAKNRFGDWGLYDLKGRLISSKAQPMMWVDDEWVRAGNDIPLIKVRLRGGGYNFMKTTGTLVSESTFREVKDWHRGSYTGEVLHMGDWRKVSMDGRLIY